MKAKQIAQAISTIQECLKAKLGTGNDAAVTIRADSVDLDNADGEVLVNCGTSQAVGEELEQ